MLCNFNLFYLIAPQKANLFASASDDGTIRIYDTTSLLSGKIASDAAVSVSGSVECIQVGSLCDVIACSVFLLCLFG